MSRTSFSEPARVTSLSQPLFEQKASVSNLVLVIADWSPTPRLLKHNNQSASTLLELRDDRSSKGLQIWLFHIVVS